MEDGQQVDIGPEASQAVDVREDYGKQCMDFTNSSMRVICTMMFSHMRIVEKLPDIMEEIDEGFALWGTVLKPADGLLDIVRESIQSLGNHSFMKKVVHSVVFNQVITEATSVIKQRAALEKAVPRVKKICDEFETIKSGAKCCKEIKDSKFKRIKMEQALRPIIELIIDVKKLQATCGEDALLFSDDFQTFSGGLRLFCEETLSALQRSCLDVLVPLMLRWAKAEFCKGDEQSFCKALESIQDGLYGAVAAKEDLLIFSTSETKTSVGMMLDGLTEAFWLQHTM